MKTREYSLPSERASIQPPDALLTAANVRDFFDWLAAQSEQNPRLLEQFMTMHIGSLQYLAEKQLRYQGEAYLDQIEKNAVYLGLGVQHFCSVAASYLGCGAPAARSQEEISSLLLQGRQSALAEAAFHVRYVREGCRGCAYHDRHAIVSGYRDQRQRLSVESYIEELEYGCIVFQMRFQLMQYYVTLLLSNRQWRGAALAVGVTVVGQILEDRVAFRANLYSSLSLKKEPRGDSRDVSYAAEQWRAIWGEQFDKIKASLR